MRLRIAVLATVVIALGAGCSSAGHVSSRGPLDASGDPGTQCVPQPTTQPLTFGLNIMKNTGTSDVQLRSVELIKPVALKVLDARVFVLPATPTDLVGMWATYPPTAAQLAANGIVWSSVHEADNFTIRPGETANLVLELSRTEGGTIGTAQATQIDYTSNKRAYRATTNTVIQLAPSADC
jgi:hypothetical protein